jgi:hypothetical protein
MTWDISFYCVKKICNKKVEEKITKDQKLLTRQAKGIAHPFEMLKKL